jgi:hypothetical protein
MIPAVLALAGCVTVGSIQQFGKDAYIVPLSEVPAHAVLLGNRFCAAKGRVMQPESMASQSFVFRCVIASAAKATTWGPAAHTVIVEKQP